MQSLLILGRQPELGVAELESLYGAKLLRIVNERAICVDIDPCLLAYDRLGGSIKFCKVLTTLATTSWHDIEAFLKQAAPQHVQAMPPGKMRLGFSVIGLKVSTGRLQASGLTLKKILQKTGRSVRLIPNKTLELSTAQVLHNQLTNPTGWELIFIRDNNQTIVAQTVKIQDINSYSLRDRSRPKRDSRVGMLPPKLAQIIINLACGLLPADQLKSICEIPAGHQVPRPQLNKTVLDPFCGTGVILQEALLDGYTISGSDLEPRMVDYAHTNLAWFAQTYGLKPEDYNIVQGDATRITWKPPIDFVASETYLGRPFTSFPTAEILTRTVSDCNHLLKLFLNNLHRQIPRDTRLCLAVPAWQISSHNFKRLPLIDQISELGYNQVSFEHLQRSALIYYRPDQIVARELVVLIRK